MTLKEAREIASISQSDLDREAEVPRGTTNDIECGRNLRPAADVAIRLVRALQSRGLTGVTVEKLFAKPMAKAATR